MKIQVALIAAAAALVAATPAAANEARVEARGGIVWAGGENEPLAGAAVGYDFDLGSTAFAGVEASGDKVLVDGADVVWGATVRAGAKLGEGKLYAAGGYSFGEGEDVPHLGGGYQHDLSSGVYVKWEYRHFFSDVVDADVVAMGLGMSF
jgi:outer membrane immunogenic protein